MRVIGSFQGQDVQEIVIGKPGGLRATVFTWGATLRSLYVPTPGGGYQNVVLSLDGFEEYLAHRAHMGAIAGRVANRIGGGSFELDGKVYVLPRNDRGLSTLHGGEGSFGQRLWRLLAHDEDQATFALTSPHGDLGFPGTLSVRCTYQVLAPSMLRIQLTAEADAPTLVNLAAHGYFNLDGSPVIDEHVLAIHAPLYTPVDANLIPTGEIKPVSGTIYDFQSPRVVGPDIFDINYVLARNGKGRAALVRGATLRSLANGVGMEIWTTEPGLQFYDGHALSSSCGGARAGLCLEPQGFPDAPNQPGFPSVIVRPGIPYRQVTEYRFASVR